MNEAAARFMEHVLPELVRLGVDLFRRHKGDHSAAIREIARIRDHGANFAKADAANRGELERITGKPKP